MKLIILTKSDLHNSNVVKTRVEYTDFKYPVVTEDIEKADLVLYIDDKDVQVIKSRF
jgi:hypothetical protein